MKGEAIMRPLGLNPGKRGHNGRMVDAWGEGLPFSCCDNGEQTWEMGSSKKCPLTCWERPMSTHK